jgi:uncharacterized protein (UPF0262 family)
LRNGPCRSGPAASPWIDRSVCPLFRRTDGESALTGVCAGARCGAPRRARDRRAADRSRARADCETRHTDIEVDDQVALPANPGGERKRVLAILDLLVCNLDAPAVAQDGLERQHAHVRDIAAEQRLRCRRGKEQNGKMSAMHGTLLAQTHLARDWARSSASKEVAIVVSWAHRLVCATQSSRERAITGQSMIPKSGYRFSEKDHAQTIT